MTLGVDASDSESQCYLNISIKNARRYYKWACIAFRLIYKLYKPPDVSRRGFVQQDMIGVFVWKRWRKREQILFNHPTSVPNSFLTQSVLQPQVCPSKQPEKMLRKRKICFSFGPRAILQCLNFTGENGCKEQLQLYKFFTASLNSIS